MKMNTNSNVYTVVYAAVMVIIVAFLLAAVASSLKDIQNANEANDTKGQILTALGYDKAAIDVAAVYAEKVQDNVFAEGELTPCPADEFQIKYGALIKDGVLHVFTAETADGQKAYVIPVVGRGLWGGLWGYIAVNEAKDTVLGTYFYHESETAGLGARIGEDWFQKQFVGKPIFGADGQVALTVVKAGSAQAENEVDGVTGATLTSNGVAAMVKEGLTIYAAFLGAGAAEAPACEGKCQCECPCAEGECQCAEGECCGQCPKTEGECCGKCPKTEGECCGKCEKNNVEQD